MDIACVHQSKIIPSHYSLKFFRNSNATKNKNRKLSFSTLEHHHCPRSIFQQSINFSFLYIYHTLAQGNHQSTETLDKMRLFCLSISDFFVA